MYAIVPLKNCPHLSLLRPEEAPECKLSVNDNLQTLILCLISNHSNRPHQ